MVNSAVRFFVWTGIRRHSFKDWNRIFIDWKRLGFLFVLSFLNSDTKKNDERTKARVIFISSLSLSRQKRRRAEREFLPRSPFSNFGSHLHPSPSSLPSLQPGRKCKKKRKKKRRRRKSKGPRSIPLPPFTSRAKQLFNLISPSSSLAPSLPPSFSLSEKREREEEVLLVLP